MGHAAKEKHYEHRAHGGRMKADKHTPVHAYNAEGSPEAAEAMDEEPGFKKGGKPHEKRKRGGHAEGTHEKKRMDKRARGGHVPAHHKGAAHGEHGHGGEVHHRTEHIQHHHVTHHMPKRARGGEVSPYSSAGRHAEGAKDTPAGRGHEGVRVPTEDD